MPALDEQILGAEQAHAFSAITLDRFSVRLVFNIGREANAMAIQRDRRLEQGLAQLLLKTQLFADELPILIKRLLCGPDDDHAVKPIEQRVCSSLELSARVL